MRHPERKIVRIEASPDAKVERLVDCSHISYGFAAFYILEDGRRIPTVLGDKVQEEAVEMLNFLPAVPLNLVARLDENGTLVAIFQTKANMA